MSPCSPRISILSPSYNHERFINFFVSSVLNQTEQSFELIIVDDKSTDKNIKEVEQYKDFRIKLIKHNFNKGINAALNEAFFMARGKYIVLCASDDILEPNHLEMTANALDENPEASVIYTALNVIDQNNDLVNKILQPNNKDRFGILHDLFLFGNSIPSPGMVVRRECLEKYMPLDISMCQMQDYQLHINILLGNEAKIINEPLVKYRVNTKNESISARTPIVIKREILETKKLMNTFLKIDTVDLLRKIFKEELEQFQEPTEDTIPYYLGRLALLSNLNSKKDWGYKTIMEFISKNNNFQRLNDLYGFTFKDYLNLANLCL